MIPEVDLERGGAIRGGPYGSTPVFFCFVFLFRGSIFILVPKLQSMAPWEPRTIYSWSYSITIPTEIQLHRMYVVLFILSESNMPITHTPFTISWIHLWIMQGIICNLVSKLGSCTELLSCKCKMSTTLSSKSCLKIKKKKIQPLLPSHLLNIKVSPYIQIVVQKKKNPQSSSL